MPLAGTQAVLGNAIANALLAPNADAATAAKIRQQWIAIANIILTHIAANAVVSTTVTTAVVGTSPAGPVTGTGTGTGVGTVS